MTETSTVTWLTQEAFDRLKAEYDHLVEFGRKEIVERIEAARSEGDLKDNGGYHAARERQGWLEARISNIKSRMPYYVVIDPAEMSGEKVAFAATVELEDMETGETAVIEPKTKDTGTRRVPGISEIRGKQVSP